MSITAVKGGTLRHIWLLDSGCTRPMANDVMALRNIVEANSTVEMGKRDTVKMLKDGILSATIVLDKVIEAATIEQVAHVPERTANVRFGSCI